MESITIRDVVRTLKISDDQYYKDVAYLKDSIDIDLSLLSIAIKENNKEEIRTCKRNINESRRKLMELEYYPFKNKESILV